MEIDCNWTPHTPGKDNGKATASGEKEAAQCMSF